MTPETRSSSRWPAGSRAHRARRDDRLQARRRRVRVPAQRRSTLERPFGSPTGSLQPCPSPFELGSRQSDHSRASGSPSRSTVRTEVSCSPRRTWRCLPARPRHQPVRVRPDPAPPGARPRAAESRPARRRGPARAPGGLPTAGAPGQQRHRRGRGPASLGPPHPRHHPSGGVHPACRGQRCRSSTSATGSWRQSLRQLRLWDQSSPDQSMHISVNVSPRQLDDPEFVGRMDGHPEPSADSIPAG